MGNLFALEEVAWKLTGEERLILRQTQSLPIINEMISRVKEGLHLGKILPKSKFKEALGYFCSLIPHLKNYTLYANARLDNNVAERAIRPIAIGRKIGCSSGVKRVENRHLSCYRWFKPAVDWISILESISKMSLRESWAIMRISCMNSSLMNGKKHEVPSYDHSMLNCKYKMGLFPGYAQQANLQLS